MLCNIYEFVFGLCIFRLFDDIFVDSADYFDEGYTVF